MVRDGVLVRGIDGAAGEIGHLPVGGDAPCTCGQVGCLETVASGSALARLWPVAGRRATNPFAAAAAGDALAAAAVDVLCTGVGLAVQLLALASGAERVVIGGGLAGLGAPLLDGIRADLDGAHAASPDDRRPRPARPRSSCCRPTCPWRPSAPRGCRPARRPRLVRRLPDGLNGVTVPGERVG